MGNRILLQKTDHNRRRSWHDGHDHRGRSPRNDAVGARTVPRDNRRRYAFDPTGNKHDVWQVETDRSQGIDRYHRLIDSPSSLWSTRLRYHT